MLIPFNLYAWSSKINIRTFKNKSSSLPLCGQRNCGFYLKIVVQMSWMFQQPLRFTAFDYHNTGIMILYLRDIENYLQFLSENMNYLDYHGAYIVLQILTDLYSNQ